MKGRKILLVITVFVTMIIFLSGQNMEPAENLDVISGAGYDIKSIVDGTIVYSVPLSIYTFQGETSISSVVRTGDGSTIAQTRSSRQNKSSKKFLLGLEKVYVINEDIARNSLRNIIDILFTNPQVNDTGVVVICKQKAEDILKTNVKGYPSAADFLEGLVKYSKGQNFFGKNYKIMDLFVRVDSEGRSAVVPYIELKDGQLQITGMAILKTDKMVDKIDSSSMNTLNFLRDTNTQGIISFEESYKRNLDYYAKVIRKVEVQKEEGKYKFKIKLAFTGDVISNQIYKDLMDSTSHKSDLEAKLKATIEKMSNKFIDDMKNKYKVDCLELGRNAVAKYGRHTGVNWDEIVTNSEITVDVKVKIDSVQRGNY